MGHPWNRGTAPFARLFVTMTKQEHIQLKTVAERWQILHRKVLGRLQWREPRHPHIVRELSQKFARLNPAVVPAVRKMTDTYAACMNNLELSTTCRHTIWQRYWLNSRMPA